MKTLILAAIRCSLMFTAVGALSLAHPASVQAVPTTYRYTGNPFTEVHGVYTTSMFVTVTLTLPHALQANSAVHEVHPTAYTFFDGVQTLDTSTPNTQTLFFFGTRGGEIIFWQSQITTEPTGFPLILTAGPNIGGAVDLGALDGADNFGRIFGFPGQWSGQFITPDAGSTLSLMTLTLMALGLVARRFQRGAA